MEITVPHVDGRNGDFCVWTDQALSSLGQYQMVHFTEEESGQSKWNVTKIGDTKHSSV